MARLKTLPPRSNREPPGAAAAFEHRRERFDGGDVLVVDAGDNVATPHSECGGVRALLHAEDDDAKFAVVALHPEFLRDGGRQIGDLRAGKRVTAGQVAGVARRLLERRAQGDRRLQDLALAEHAELDRASHALGHEAVLQGLWVLHDLAVDADDHVADLQARTLRRTFFMEARHERTRRPVEPKRLRDVGSQRLQGRAEPWPLDFAAIKRRLNHELHHVGRNRKSDTVRAAALGEDRRVETGEPPVHVDERAAGIAGIDRRVGLNEELIV